MTQGQKRTIDIANYFKPTVINLSSGGLSDLSSLQLTTVIESPDGVTPEKAFLMRTERGKNPEKVTDLKQFASLLAGHNRAALNSKAWSEGFREGTLFMIDFEDEPDYIQELAKKAYEGGKSNRYSHIKRLGFTEYTLELARIFPSAEFQSITNDAKLLDMEEGENYS